LTFFSFEAFSLGFGPYGITSYFAGKTKKGNGSGFGIEYLLVDAGPGVDE